MSCLCSSFFIFKIINFLNDGNVINENMKKYSEFVVNDKNDIETKDINLYAEYFRKFK